MKSTSIFTSNAHLAALIVILICACQDQTSVAQSVDQFVVELDRASKLSASEGLLGEVLFDKYNCTVHIDWAEKVEEMRSIKFDLSKLHSGIYTLQLSNFHGVISRKIIKQ